MPVVSSSTFQNKKTEFLVHLPWARTQNKASFCQSESCSVVSNFLQPHALFFPWNSPGQNTGVSSLFFLQVITPNPGIKPRSPALQADSLPAEPQGKPKNIGVGSHPFSSRSSQPRNWTGGLLNCRWILYQLSYHYLCISHIVSIPIYRIKFPVFCASVSSPLKWQDSHR